MPTIRSYNKRLEMLRSERSPFIDVYKQLSDYHLGYRGRFLTSDRNKGYHRNTKQYNNKSRLALRTMASGMMSGISSPARPWFKLGAPDPEMNEFAPVKHWLHQVQSTMYRVFNHSNLYNSLHSLYAETGTFATGNMGVYEDFDNVIRCKTRTAGAYMIGRDGQGKIDTLYCEYDQTVGELVKQFGIKNCSLNVQQKWKNGNTESWVPIVHAIEPNDDRDNSSPLARDKKFRSVYYEKERRDDNFLRESGFDDFPELCPRWDLADEDIYGTDCPGMIALGDTKSLQLSEKRLAQAIDKVGSPPLQGSVDIRNSLKNGSLIPDQIVWLDQNVKGLESIYGNYKPDINAILMVIEKREERISRAFYEDLFLMLANSDRRQITAREVAEKQEEKLLMLGPVLERLHSELHDPLIDRTFNILQKHGVLPPPPRELMQTELKVEYISILAQAQRLVSVSGTERFARFVSDISAVWPEARNKVDAQQMVDEYADSIGVNPRVVRPDDEADAVTAAQAKAQQQSAAQEQGVAMADAAKTMSETSVEGDNALATVMRNAGLA